ncbi:MAG: glycoside hydrolase family 92 protein [Bacteroidota bacterium]|nr:glycoside hydrolase family 92 protein [Bacteroidota bacterium]
MGGKAQFELMLDSLFTQTSELLGEDTEDVTGMIGQYSQGNEPDHNFAYLYDFIDKPEKTQFYTNKIINTLYLDSPAGLSGNEDCGQMSAWYVFSAMGSIQLIRWMDATISEALSSKKLKCTCPMAKHSPSMQKMYQEKIFISSQ